MDPNGRPIPNNSGRSGALNPNSTRSKSGQDQDRARHAEARWRSGKRRYCGTDERAYAFAVPAGALRRRKSMASRVETH